MMDENDRSHEDYRSLRHISRKEGFEDTAPIEVDSSAFFSELPPEQLPPHTASAQPSQKPLVQLATDTPACRPSAQSRPWMEPWQYLPSGGKFC